MHILNQEKNPCVKSALTIQETVQLAMFPRTILLSGDVSDN